MNIAYIHTSDIRTFKTCRRAWNFSSSLRLNKVPERAPRYFIRGRAMHKAFEGYYREGLDMIEVFSESYVKEVIEGADRPMSMWDALELDWVREDISIGEEVLPEYLYWAESHDDYDEIVDVEAPGVLPMPDVNLVGTRWNEAKFSYRADMIVRRKGGLWLVDFKTTKQLPMRFKNGSSSRRLDYIDLDEQITGYLRSVEAKYGKPFVGAIFIYVLFKAPSTPKVLSSGKLSKDRSQRTSARVFLDELATRGLEVDDYRDFIRFLSTDKEWVLKVEVVRNRDEMEHMWSVHQQLVSEMLSPNVLIYPNPGPLNCSGCAYYYPCLAANAGRDREARRILDSEFRDAPDRDKQGDSSLGVEENVDDLSLEERISKPMLERADITYGRKGV